MGLVLNPYAYRIGHTKTWADSWYLFSTEYVEFLHSSMFLKVFVHYVLYKFHPTRFSYWLLSHTEILFFNNCMYIWLYLYEASNRYKITKYIKLLKFGAFKNLRMQTYWLKKRLFNRNPVATSVFNFLKIFSSHIEKFDVIINYVLSDEDRSKIEYLRRKYGRKWLGKEEVAILRSALSLFKRSANYYALSEFLILTKALFFFPFSTNVYNQSKIDGARIFLFFMSYIMFIIKSWSYYRSKKLAFVTKFIFVLLRWTSYWLFFRPFVAYLSKFLEYLCSFFGYIPIVRVSIITNFTLSAFFIARYIMTAMKNGFNYLDIVFPIRKTLNRFMQLKVFDSFVNKNTHIKGDYRKAALSSSKKRVGYILLTVYFIKSRLFVNDLNIYSNVFNKNIYLKAFSLNNLLNNSRNFYNSKFKIFSIKKHLVSFMRSSAKRSFRRYFSRKVSFFVNNKIKLFRSVEKLLFFIVFLKIFKFVRFKRKKKKYKRIIQSNIFVRRKISNNKRAKKIRNKISFLKRIFLWRFRLLNIVVKRFYLFFRFKRVFFLKRKIKIMLNFFRFKRFFNRLLLTKFHRRISRYTDFGLINKLNYVYSPKYNNRLINKSNRTFFRGYHSSSLLSDNIISVLKSIVNNNRSKKNKFNKRAFRPGIDYSKILSNMIISKYYDDKSLNVRLPSKLLFIKYWKSVYLKNVNNNVLFNNSYIDYLVFDIQKQNLNLSRDNCHVIYMYILLKFYKYIYVLLFIKLNTRIFFRLSNIIFFVKFIVCNFNSLSIDFNLFVKLKSLMRSIDNVTLRVVNKFHFNKMKNFNKYKYAMFTFIHKFSDLFVNNAAYLSSFYYYFFYLLKQISSNYRTILSINNEYISRLLYLIDFYWYYGYCSSKRKSLKKFKKFFLKFKSVIYIVLIVFRLLFTTKFKINDDLSSFFYDSFRMLLPTNIDFKIIHYGEHYFTHFIYLNDNFSKDAVLNRSIFFSSFKHYLFFFEDLKFVEKFFHCFFVNNFIEKKFPVTISSYFIYMNELLDSSKRIFGLTVEFITTKLLSYSDKIVRVKARDNVKSFLYGFKFHFVGRFTRKQQSASMWFRQGFLPVSTMDAEVDYGMFTLPLRFSACTVKIWLYRGTYVPKRLITFDGYKK